MAGNGAILDYGDYSLCAFCLFFKSFQEMIRWCLSIHYLDVTHAGVHRKQPEYTRHIAFRHHSSPLTTTHHHSSPLTTWWPVPVICNWTCRATNGGSTGWNMKVWIAKILFSHKWHCSRNEYVIIYGFSDRDERVSIDLLSAIAGWKNEKKLNENTCTIKICAQS